MSKKYRFGIVILATLLLAALFAFAPGALAAECIYGDGGILEKVSAVDATCTSEGNIACWQCNVCRKYFQDEAGNTPLNENDVIIPTNDNHDYSDVDHTVDPTCTEEGYTIYKCSRCGSVDGENKRDKTSALNHSFTKYVYNNDATCTTAGTQTAKCDRCDATDTKEYPALDHDWGDPTYTWAEDYSTCTAERVCGRDASHVETETANSTSEVTTAATCEGKGTTTYTAAFTNTAFSTQTKAVENLPAIGHDLEHVEAKAATCTEAGNIEYWHCTRAGCGKYFSDAAATTAITQEQTVVAAGGHIWGEPTYTWAEDNSACTATRVCGRDASHVETEAVNSTSAVKTAATCEGKGTTTYTATFTNAAFAIQTKDVENIPALGHELEHVEAKAATCTDAGNIEYWHCKREGCGKYFSDAAATTAITQEQTVVAAGHIWGDPAYTWAADYSACTATRVCSRDASHVETETVTATKTEETAATYTTEGKRVYTSAAFTNAAFTVQTKEESIPVLVNYILKFDSLGEIYYSYKPELKAALAMMPTNVENVEATLSDNTKVKVKVTLRWTKDSAPTGYAEKEGDGTYTFTAANVTPEGNYTLADNVVKPTCNLVVGPAKYSDDYADYTYRLNAANEVTIIKCTVKENITDVVVPEKFGDNQPVTYVEAEAFKKNEALVRLVLPKGLLSIGDKAFAGCTALETLVVPDSLQSVGTEMFKSVKTMVSLTLQTDMESTLTADNTVTHTLVVDEKEVPYTVEMPTAFTDFIVNSSTFTMDCDYTVAAEHSITVNPAATMNVLADRRLKNLGAVANNGAINNWGTVVTCGGEWPAAAPVDQADGKFITTHIYEKGVCTGCGIKEEIIVTELTITYTGSGLDKVYDKTRNVTVTGSDFRISGTRSGHTSVRIAGIRAAYDAPDVGDRKITISFTLGGDDVDWYTCSDITVSAKITPKPLIITPNEGQKKFYGAADPTYFTGTVKGLLEGDSISGRLARETGEDVGKYKIIQGTIDAGTNYDVQVQEAYFNIEAKSINSTDVGLVTIGNQKYTGQPIKPTITLRYGTLTLKQDTDFKAEYTDNVKVGTAKVKLTGIGNYTGDRETSFRILDTGSGGGGGGGGSSGGDDDDDDFGTGSDEFEDEDEDEEDEDTGKLILNDVDYGDVLLGMEGEPRAFTLMDETDGQGRRVLTIMPDPMTDEETGDSIYLDEDNMRERYNEMHLRISSTLAQTLANQGISEIVYQLDQADLHIPLASLVAELPLDAPDPEKAGEGVAAEDGAEEMEVAPRALEISAYDICVEQVDAIKLTNTETRAALLAEGIIVPGGADEAEAATAEPAEAPAEGEVVKQLDPRVDALLLSERETAQLDDYQSLMVPAYRARVRVILEGQEPEPTGLKDSNGEPLPQMVPKALPDGVYPKDIRMMLLPDEVPQGESTEVQTVRAAVLNTPWDPSAITFETARFEDLDGMTYAAVPLERDGIYAVTMPEVPEDDYEDDFEDDEDEEEYVDFA